MTLLSALPSVTPIGAGGAQLSYVETYDGRVVTTNGVLTQNAAHLCLVRVAKSLPVTVMEWYVTAQNGNVNAGIFSWDGTTWTPLASTGSTAAGGANAVQSVALTTGYVFNPGVDYWLALATDSATFACLRVAAISTAVGGAGSRVIIKAANFALAAITAPTSGTLMPWLRAK